MADEQNSSRSGDNNVMDQGNEFEFNPSEWMVLDDDDNDEEHGDPVDHSLVEKDKGALQDNVTKNVNKRQQQRKLSSAPVDNSIRLSEGKDLTAKKGTKSPGKDLKRNDKDSSKSTATKGPISNNRDQRTHCPQIASSAGNDKKNVKEIADVFNKDKMPSAKRSGEKVTRSTTTKRAPDNSTSIINPKAATGTSAITKRKAEDNVIRPPPTKHMKHTAGDQSQLSSQTKCEITVQNTAGRPQAKSGLKQITRESSISSCKDSSQQVHDKKQTVDAVTPKGKTTSQQVHDKKHVGEITPKDKTTSQQVHDKKHVGEITPKDKTTSQQVHDKKQTVGAVTPKGKTTSQQVHDKKHVGEITPKDKATSQQVHDKKPNVGTVTVKGKTTSQQVHDKKQTVGAVTVKGKTTSQQVRDKKQTVGAVTPKEQLTLAGGSIAEAMGVKILENSTTGNVVDDKDIILSVTNKQFGTKQTCNEGSASNRDNKTSPASLQKSVKDPASTVNTTSTGSATNTPSATPGVSKKRIIRRFHRTTQTLAPHVSNKQLQCLIKIPSLDWPKKPSRCEIGLMADIVVTSSDQPSSVKNVAVKADSVAEDVFNEALSFGKAEDGTVPPKPIQEYGIRFYKILSSDTEKANTNIKKADGYRLSFPNKKSGSLDLFYQEEEGVVQMYNYFRKHRLGPRHVCLSVVRPASTSVPGVTATIVFDQNYASSAYLAYAKASVWNKPKADVFVSVHNVPKNVPLSLFTVIFPEAVIVEMDDPNLKVTEETSNRVKLGLPRKVVDNFLSLFSQVVVNNTPLVFSSGLTQEEDVPEMKAIIAERVKLAELVKLKSDDQDSPTLTAVPRDINSGCSKPKFDSEVESEVIMQVEDVESIEKVLKGRSGAWKGPSTPDNLRPKAVSSSPAQKSHLKSCVPSKLIEEELSDISDNSDFGEDEPKVRLCGVTASDLQSFGSPDVLNRWRQTKPLNTIQYGRHERDYSAGESSRQNNDSHERVIDLRRQEPPGHRQQRTISSNADREGRRLPQTGGSNRDTHETDLDRRHKVIVAGRPHRSGHSASSLGGSAGRESDGEEDLRCMLENLKSRRSSKADSSLVNRTSVEFVRRSDSPNNTDRGRRGSPSISDRVVCVNPSEGDKTQVVRRLERDRRVVSRTSISPVNTRCSSPFRPYQREHNVRERSPLSPLSARHARRHSPFAPGRSGSSRQSLSPPHTSRKHQHQQSGNREVDREHIQKRSLSPRGRERIRKRSLSPRGRDGTQKRTLSPRGRERIRKRSSSPRGRERLQKRSLSPILPFRPGQRINKGSEEPQKSSLEFNKPFMKDKISPANRSCGESNVGHWSGPGGGDQDIAKSKTLYNTLMDRLREKADGYQQSKDRNLMDAAKIYNQINDLAETLTAIKNDKDAVKQFGTGLDQMDAMAARTASNELHPDLLRYVNVKPAVSSSSNSKGLMGSTSTLPPPIPPPVAPPLFTSDSPTDKKAQLEAIAKQLVSDFKFRGGGVGDGGEGSSGGGGNVSGGMWMVPPPTPVTGPPTSTMNPVGGGGHLGVPPPVVGGPFSMPPPPVPAMMPQPPGITPMGLLNMAHLAQPWNNNNNNNGNSNNPGCRQS